MALRYSWVSIAVAVLLVALFIREWRLSRIHADALLARIEAATADREREGRIAIRELRASIGSLRAELRQVRLPEPAARGSVEPSAAPGQPPDMLAHMGASDHLESSDAPQLSSPLPELPPGVHADNLVRTLDVDGILSDSRLNPDGRVLPRAARFRATEILVRAKTEAERLETEIASALAEELDELRTAGDFEYLAPGVRPLRTGPDVWSVGESAAPDEGTRMYYIFREDRPELFEKRSRIRDFPAIAIREVLALIAERGEEPIGEK